MITLDKPESVSESASVDGVNNEDLMHRLKIPRIIFLDHMSLEMIKTDVFANHHDISIDSNIQARLEDLLRLFFEHLT